MKNFHQIPVAKQNKKLLSKDIYQIMFYFQKIEFTFFENRLAWTGEPKF